MPFSCQYFAACTHFSGTPAVSSGLARFGLSILMMGAEMIPRLARIFESTERHQVLVADTRRRYTVWSSSRLRASSLGLRLVTSSSQRTRGT